MEDDTFYTMDLLRKGASHAFVPQSLVCCLCGYSIAKISSSLSSSPSSSSPLPSSIRLFSCGHATHLYCEPQEKGIGERDSLSGCPICIPKRKPRHLRGKSALVENTLISNPWASGGKAIYHLHDPDALEKPYGTPISRVILLSISCYPNTKCGI